MADPPSKSDLSPHIQGVLDRVHELVPDASRRLEDSLFARLRAAMSAPLSPEFRQLMEKIDKLDPGPNEHITPLAETIRRTMRTPPTSPAFKAAQDAQRKYRALADASPFPLVFNPPAREAPLTRESGAGRAPSSTDPAHDDGSNAPPPTKRPHDDGAGSAQSSTKPHKESDSAS